MNPRARADDDDETSETSDTRSDEDAFEDVRATDGFEDEEIDEDEAFNEEDDERFGEAFAGDDGELVYLASHRADAQEWLTRHGYPNAVLREISADEVAAAVVEGRTAA